MLDAHKKLEFEMSVDAVKEVLPKLGETAKSFYDALLKQGFTDVQALYLTSRYVDAICGFNRKTT